MKLSFDMDGTICDGRYLERCSDLQMYLGLTPYDMHTRDVWNQIVREHDVSIITSRSWPGAAKGVRLWLEEHCFVQPDAIITMSCHAKNHAGKALIMEPLGIEAHFDDSAEVFNTVNNNIDTKCYLLDNPNWEANQICFCGDRRVTSWLQIGKIIASIDSRQLQAQ